MDDYRKSLNIAEPEQYMNTFVPNREIRVFIRWKLKIAYFQLTLRKFYRNFVRALITFPCIFRIKIDSG